MKQLNNLADLKYGKVNLEDIEMTLIDAPKIDKILFNFLSEPYPNLVDTQKEITIIQETQKRFAENKDKLNFCRDADEDLHHLLTDIFESIGIKVNSDFFEIDKIIGYITVKLKRHYNRPRPYQVAYYTEQYFNPFETITGNSPSYPSGHALQGYLMCSILAKKYPQHKTKLDGFAELIAESRVALGVHYPSDNRFSKEICKKLMQYEDLLWQSVKDKA